jgi:hypothetical protein
MSTPSDSNLIAFKAIANFTSELSELFSDKQRSLKLYSRLISKTTISHEAPIAKHIEAFRTFCVTNRQALLDKDYLKFSENKVEYSERVYINMRDVLKIADKETAGAIWKHLLLISALLDPAGKAREMLAKGETTESNFLTDILSKVEGEFDPNASPMEAMSSIMSSGVFTDLIGSMNSGLQDGSLDLPKLMGTVQGMVSTLSEQAGDAEGGAEAMNMIKTMMGNMQVPSGEEGGEAQPPDLMAMMGPMLAGMGGMGGMGGGGGGGGGGIGAAIEAQVAAAEARGELPSTQRAVEIFESTEPEVD